MKYSIYNDTYLLMNDGWRGLVNVTAVSYSEVQTDEEK